jgi:hypothetical protein
VYAYATSAMQPEERERFDALLEGRDYDREQRRKVAAMIGTR